MDSDRHSVQNASLSPRSRSAFPPSLPALSPLGPRSRKAPDAAHFVPITMMTSQIDDPNALKVDCNSNPFLLPPPSLHSLALPPLATFSDDDTFNSEDIAKAADPLLPPNIPYLTFPALDYRPPRTTSPSPSSIISSHSDGASLASHSPSPLLPALHSLKALSALNAINTVPVSNVKVSSCAPPPISSQSPMMNVIYTKPAASTFTAFGPKLPFRSMARPPAQCSMVGHDELECKSESDHERPDDDHSDDDELYIPDDDLMAVESAKPSKRCSKATKSTKSKSSKSSQSSKSANSTNASRSRPLRSSRKRKRKSSTAPTVDDKKCGSRKKKAASSRTQLMVKPVARGHGSISWSDLCRTSLQCHFCGTEYTDSNGGRTAYVDCLKAHYHADPDLEYLTCELCLVAPTPLNAKKKEKCNGEGDEWRKCKHAANFISHLAGHSEAGLQPGFVCRVETWDESTGQYVPCGTRSSTRQNLAKHVYNMHYKEGDEEEEFTVIPEHGFVDRLLAKDLVKPGKRRKNKRTKVSKSTRTKSSKSTKSTKSNKSTKATKCEAENVSTSTDSALEIVSGGKRSRSNQPADRQLRSRSKKRRKVDVAEDDVSSSTTEVKVERVPCRTLSDQMQFVDKMTRCGYFLLFLDALDE